ncbi:hypothetical protein [Paracoccus sp. (in: a-proteobacteria)]|uniref:hypothetical protein n=1 Tax=Paracoccus sp. TaxID=267 RepID=UPI002B000436|nr:hypothetical protein [Paracoccus sp. (in: a-proteobacteria)]
MASATKRIILSSGWVKIAEAKGREAMAMIDAYGAVQLAVADGEPPRGDVASGHSLNGTMMWPVKGAEIIWARGAGVAVSVTLLKVVPEFATLDSAAIKVATASAQAVATAAAGAAATADAKATDALDSWAAWDAIAEVDPHRFGAVGFTYDELVTANGSGMAAIAAANDAAFIAANALLEQRGGGVIRYRGLIYPFSATLTRGSNVRVEGAGTGRYNPLSVTGRTWDGTTFLFYGEGPKVHSFPGITSGENNGGWIEDPDNPGEYFKLWSAYGGDASGAAPSTLRQFSVAVLDNKLDGSGGFEKIRVLPWRGTDGVSDYLNPSAPVWGANWDFGYVVQNAEYVSCREFHVFGPWREAGHALMLTSTSVGQAGRAERNLFDNCQFEGRIGRLVRAPDVWKVESKTSNSFSVTWTSEHYFPPSGTVRGSDGLDYSYTGLSEAGGVLTFTGVSPDPSPIGHIRVASSGLANTAYNECLFYSLWPQDGSTPESHGISAKAEEVSGFPLRGLKSYNSKHHNRGAVLAHWHMVQDMTLMSHQFEGGGHLIASPQAAQQAAPGATYETRGLRIIGSTGIPNNADMRLFKPRNGYVDALQSPLGDLSLNYYLQALRDGGKLVLKQRDGSSIEFQNAAGTVLMELLPSGLLKLLNGNQFTFVGGVARINYQSGQYLTIREGTDVRLNVSGTSIHSGQDGVVALGGASNKFTRAHLSDGVFINNQRVLGPRAAAIPNSAGGDEQATINAILAALRTHGLIST